MQCPRCQHENSPKAKFCEECAAPLARAYSAVVLSSPSQPSSVPNALAP